MPLAQNPRGADEADLERHLRRSRYGSFVLTDAIRPMLGSPVVPQEGYRQEVYRQPIWRNGCHHRRTNMLIASVSSERLFDVFLALLDPIGDEVDCGVMTSHEIEGYEGGEFYRPSIDLPVLKSALCYHEELLLGDGCTGFAAWSDDAETEVQLDEHKLLIVYGQELSPFKRILTGHSVPRVDGIQFVTDSEHVHLSDEKWLDKVDELVAQIGADGDGEDDGCIWA